ncbi:exported hypothetical protein [Curtobacterium sp. 8I-2]|nr:exported hypothetical protein [Curtobacterium sp. 8I-2]
MARSSTPARSSSASAAPTSTPAPTSAVVATTRCSPSRPVRSSSAPRVAARSSTSSTRSRSNDCSWRGGPSARPSFAFPADDPVGTTKHLEWTHGDLRRPRDPAPQRGARRQRLRVGPP